MQHPPPPPDPCALPLARRGPPTRQPAGFVHGATAAAAGELICDASEQHLLAVAPTGAGKGVSLLLPWLLSYAGSAIVIDPKGEAAAVTARWRRGIGHRVCVVDPWRLTAPAAEGPEALNPMQVVLPGSEDLGDDCSSLAQLVAGEAPVSMQDPFWRECALHLLTALIGWAWVRPQVTGQPQADDGTLGAVWSLLHHDDLTYHLAVLLDTVARHPAFAPFVREGFVNFIGHEGEKVRTSVRSEAVSLMRVFASQRVQQATGSTTVPLDLLREGGPVTVYLVIPPDKLDSHAAWLRIVLGSLLTLMVRRARRPALPTLFLVDELAHLGPMPQLRQAITLLRGYGVRVALFLQSLAQLKGLWPRDHEAIQENCGIWLSFGHASVASARALADQLGDIGAEALFAMDGQQLALHRAGQRTQIAARLDVLRDPLFAARADPNPRHARPPAAAGR